MDWIWKGNTEEKYELTEQFGRLDINLTSMWGPIRYYRDAIATGDNMFLMDISSRRLFAGGIVLELVKLEAADWVREYDLTGGAPQPGWYADIVFAEANPIGIELAADIDRDIRHPDRGQRATPAPISRDQRVRMYQAFLDDEATLFTGPPAAEATEVSA